MSDQPEYEYALRFDVKRPGEDHVNAHMVTVGDDADDVEWEIRRLMSRDDGYERTSFVRFRRPVAEWEPYGQSWTSPKDAAAVSS